MMRNNERPRIAEISTTTFSHNFEYIPKILNGGIAGIVGVTCVFPIDLVKTRLQNQRSSCSAKLQYLGIVDCARKTWQNSGVTLFRKIRGLYAGSGVNLFLITPEKAIKLVANDFFRNCLAVPDQNQLSVVRGMIAGGGAGFCQVVITTPMELLKIQMQDAGRVQIQSKGNQLTAMNLAINLFRQKGIFGLYKGFFPTMARDVSFSIFYFPLFAFLDSMGPRSRDGSGDAVFYASFLSGMIGGAVASFAVTPLDVIKTRMQLINRGLGEKQYKSITDGFVKILKEEGLNALFKGAVCRMMVMAPLFGIAQMVYYIGVAEFLLGVPKAAH